MSIRRPILVSTLVLTVLAFTAIPAGAHPTRELLTSFGPVEEPAGLAIDLETGNVYVTDNKTQTIYIFGSNGGAPADGVPSQITGLQFEPDFAPDGVAVDNSCYEHEPRLTGKACEEYDPSYGDVYVVQQDYASFTVRSIQKFKLNAVNKYELVMTIPPRRTPIGVAVDSRGNLYEVNQSEETPVTEFKKVVEKVASNGGEEIEERLEEVEIPQHLVWQRLGYVAVDDFGDIYLGSSAELGEKEGFPGVVKLRVDPAGSVFSEGVLAGNMAGVPRPVAVDPSTGVVYVGDGSEVAEYDAAGVLQLRFGSTEPLGGSLGEEGNGAKAIAVNGAAERVYVANPLHHDVDVFGPVSGPPVIEAAQPAASSITRTSALIAGSADPESTEGSYYFEYVDAGEYEPVAANPYRDGGRTAIGVLTGGHATQTVERLPLTGLLPGTVYHYRMVVSNATATTYGPQETFTTAPATPPVVSTGSASEVGTTSVTLSGVVGPRGLPTSYVFEVGTDTGYGGAKLFGDAGASTEEVPVSVALQYLVPGTTYHYRLTATSFDGTSYGQDGTFTTAGVPSTVAQPSSAPLIASPVVQFPSITGAITGGVKQRKVLTGAQKLAAALRVCRRQRPGKRRVACEARARKAHRRVVKNQRSKKR
jgi:hypothetical protein